MFLAKEKKTGRYVALKRMEKAVYSMKNSAGSNRVKTDAKSDVKIAPKTTPKFHQDFDDGFIGADEGGSAGNGEVPISPRDAELSLLIC